MRIKRGCGCLLLMLAGVNLLFLIAALVGLAMGSVGFQMGMLALALFGANLVASFMLGLAGVRGQLAGGAGEADSAVAEAEGDTAVEEDIE